MSGTRVYPDFEFGDVLKSSPEWDGTEREEVRLMYVGPRSASKMAFWGLVLTGSLTTSVLSMVDDDVFYRGQKVFWEKDPDWT